MDEDRLALREDLMAMLAAGREMSSDVDGHLADIFLDRLDADSGQALEPPRRRKRRPSTGVRWVTAAAGAAVLSGVLLSGVLLMAAVPDSAHQVIRFARPIMAVSRQPIVVVPRQRVPLSVPANIHTKVVFYPNKAALNRGVDVMRLLGWSLIGTGERGGSTMAFFSRPTNLR
ncbi:MAG: hypothetical protein ACRDFS_10960 [Chloroflexota bacterium]